MEFAESNLAMIKRQVSVGGDPLETFWWPNVPRIDLSIFLWSAFVIVLIMGSSDLTGDRGSALLVGRDLDH